MWIESQDSDSYVNLRRTKNLRIERVMEQRKYTQVLVSCDVYADETLLGEYPNEKQAKRALNLVKQELFNSGHESEYLMKMPKCMEEKEEENGNCV